MSSINDLLIAIMNRDFGRDSITDDILFVEERFDLFRKYFNAVYDHVYKSSTASTMMRGGEMDMEKYKDTVMKYDSSRTVSHDAVIGACAQINRLCDTYGIEHLCPDVETNENGKCLNRGEIGDFVGKFMYMMFRQGRDGRMMEPLFMPENNANESMKTITVT